jgi:hypothetical protein
LISTGGSGFGSVGDGDDDAPIVTEELIELPSSSVAVTVYDPEESLRVINVVLASPLLSVVPVVELSDTVPSFGLTLNVTV